MNPSLWFKLRVSSKIVDLIKTRLHENISKTAISKLLSYNFNLVNGQINLRVPVKSLKILFPQSEKEHMKCLLDIEGDDVVSSVESSSNPEPCVVFNLHHKQVVENVLLGKNFEDLETQSARKHILLDFSSPNVAKPFHVGHLRSTIIGNFLANLFEHLGHKVTRLNYLGDWGTQFGILQIGLMYLNLSNADLKKDPVQQLFNAYLTGNRLAEADHETAAKAKNIFNLMESGVDSGMMHRWNLIKDATMEELSNTYKRLGVKFDEYHFESMYNRKAFSPIEQVMESNDLLERDGDGKKVVDIGGGKKVPLLKSDGSTLYLTRDVTAALDRWVTFRFDRMLYVVDNSQNQHFTALKQVLHKLEYDWADSVEHVKFGRIQGMSTRKGQVVFLKDILDEAKLRMAEKQRQSPTTKTYSEEVSDILGVTAIIVNDLKQRRMKDYSFDWDTALQMDGDSGVKLQYTHCRLTSLEHNCGVTIPQTCDASLLCEPEAVALILEITRMGEAIDRAHSKLEAHEIVTYLFRLCNKTSQALKVLNVKNAPAAVAEQRLLLFHRARTVLHSGMRLLGLKPLTEM